MSFAFNSLRQLLSVEEYVNLFLSDRNYHKRALHCGVNYRLSERYMNEDGTKMDFLLTTGVSTSNHKTVVI
jgi:hypothetical protein